MSHDFEALSSDAGELLTTKFILKVSPRCVQQEYVQRLICQYLIN